MKKLYTFTVGVIVDMKEALRKLMSLDKLPIDIAFDLQMMLPKLSEVERVYEERRTSLIMRLGAPVEGVANTWNIPPTSPNMPIYNQEINVLRDVTITVEGPIIPEEIIKKLGSGLSAFDIFSLQDFIPEIEQKMQTETPQLFPIFSKENDNVVNESLTQNGNKFVNEPSEVAG